MANKTRKEPLDSQVPLDQTSEDARSTKRDAQTEIEPSQSPERFSQASQVGRARNSGPPDAAPKAGETAREGWAAPDQTDTPPEWPEPTID